MREHDHVFERDAVALGDVTDKNVHIFDHVVKTICGTAFSR